MEIILFPVFPVETAKTSLHLYFSFDFQVMLSSKSSHSPTAPSTMEQARALLHESGLPLLHFLPRMNGLPESLYGQGPLTPNGLGVEPSAFYSMVGVAFL